MIRAASLAWLLAVPAAAAAGPAVPARSEVIARAGPHAITVGDLDDLLAGLDAKTRATLLATPGGALGLIRNRLATMALLSEANAKDWAARPDVARQVAAARDRVVAQSYLDTVAAPPDAYPSAAQVRDAYEANKAHFVIGRQDSLEGVLVAGNAGSAAPPAGTPAALFAAGRPHAFGLTLENALRPAVRDAVAGLAVGAVSAPVRLDDGWHVFRLVATRPAHPASLDEIRPQLVAALRRQRSETDAHAYLATLLERDHARINEIALSAALAGRRD